MPSRKRRERAKVVHPPRGCIETERQTAAVYKVFGTFELLECILSHLPCRNLLVAQVICRNWKEVIERSRSLQQVLFFTPVDFMSAEPAHRSGDYTGIRDVEKRPPLDGGVVQNPMLYDFFLEQRDLAYKGRWYPTLCRPDASWRRMFVTQPPTELQFNLVDLEPPGHLITSCYIYPLHPTIRNKSALELWHDRTIKEHQLTRGLRMGDLITTDNRISWPKILDRISLGLNRLDRDPYGSHSYERREKWHCPVSYMLTGSTLPSFFASAESRGWK